ncbi:hypothetical protein ES705_16715 [subsurface metagenome]
MANRKEYLKKYYLDNKKKIDEQHAKYDFEHKEEIKEYYKNNKMKINKNHQKWAIENKDKLEEYNEQYRMDNKEKTKQYNKQWQKDNPRYSKQWRLGNPKKQKAIKVKQKALRRQLGFVPLNEPFENCEGHHISENFVIYIPAEIHRSIKHIIWNWHNMKEINQLAFKYL